MTRPVRRPPKRSRGHVAMEEVGEPVMLTDEAKRELILAHAAARSKTSRDWGIGYTVAIAASCVIVFGGWWLTLDRSLGVAKHPDGFLQILSNTIQIIRDEGVPQATRAAQALEAAAQAINQPSPTTTTSTTE